MNDLELQRTQDLYFFGVSSPNANKSTADQYCLTSERMDTLADLHADSIERGWYTPLITKHKSSQPAGEILALYRSASNDLGCVGHIDGRTPAGRHTIDNFRSIQGLSLGLTQLEKSYPGFVFPKKELVGQVLRECTITDDPNFRHDTYIKYYHNDPGYLMDTLAEMTERNGSEKDPTRLIARLPKRLANLPQVVKNYARQSRSFHIPSGTGRAPSVFRGLYQSLGSQEPTALDPFFKTDRNFERAARASPLHGPAKRRSHRTNYGAQEPRFIGWLPETGDEKEGEDDSRSLSLISEEVLESFSTQSPSPSHSLASDFWKPIETDDSDSEMQAPNTQQQEPKESAPSTKGVVFDFGEAEITGGSASKGSQANPSAGAGEAANSETDFLSFLDETTNVAKEAEESQALATDFYELVQKLKKKNPSLDLAGLTAAISSGKIKLPSAPANAAGSAAAGANKQPAAGAKTNGAKGSSSAAGKLPEALPEGEAAPLAAGLAVGVNPADKTGAEKKAGNAAGAGATGGKAAAGAPAPGAAGGATGASGAAASDSNSDDDRQIAAKFFQSLPASRIPVVGALAQYFIKDLGIKSKDDLMKYIADVSGLKEKAEAAEAEAKKIKEQEEIRRHNVGAKLLVDRMMTGSLKSAMDSKNPKMLAKAVGKENADRFTGIMKALITNERAVDMADAGWIAEIATTADARLGGTNQTSQAKFRRAYDNIQEESQSLYDSISSFTSKTKEKPAASSSGRSTTTAQPQRTSTAQPPTPQPKKVSFQAPREAEEEDESAMDFVIDTTAEADEEDILFNFEKILKHSDLGHRNGAEDMSRIFGRKYSGHVNPAAMDPPAL